MKKILVNFSAILFGTFFLCSVAFGQVASWDFTGENNVATSTADNSNANLTATPILTRGSGAAASAGNNSFRTVGFQNNGISVANTDYFQVQFTASAGNFLSISTIDARLAGTNTFANSPGVTSQFAYSTDGTTFTLIGSPQVIIGTPQSLAQIDTSGISALQNVPAGTTVTLRYYASGQTTTGGWGFNSPSAGQLGLAIGGAVGTLDITNANTLPNGQQSVAYSQMLNAINGVAPFTFALANATVLPAGLTLDANGTISGTPTAPGTYNFDVTVTDSAPLARVGGFVPNATSTTESFQITVLGPLAAEGMISGRVTDVNGNGLAKVSLMLSGGELSQPIVVRTNAFGYYTLPEVEVGATYTLTVSDKRYTFANPSRVINLQENISDADFVSEN